MSVGGNSFRLADGTSGTITGEGDPLILIHGVGLARGIWAPQVRHLSPHFRTVTYDLLGHGESPPAGTEATLQDFAGQLHEVLGQVGGPASVVGFSFGGLIAQAFALHHPASLRKLVLLSTVHDRSPSERAAVLARWEATRAGGMMVAVQPALERWFSRTYLEAHPEIAEAFRQMLLENRLASFLQAYRVFATADQNLAGRVSGIACPTLVMTGEEDVGSTPQMATRLASSIPNAKLSILPGARHMMSLEHAEEVNRQLASFLLAKEER